MSDSSRPPGLKPTRLLRPWDFPGNHIYLVNTKSITQHITDTVFQLVAKQPNDLCNLSIFIHMDFRNIKTNFVKCLHKFHIFYVNYSP